MNAKTYFSKVAFVLVSILLMFQFSLRSQTVTNGDFESWTAGNPDGWTINVISSSLTFTQASGLGVTGDALQILSQSNPGGYDGNFSTVVTGITPGSYYNLSVMVKGNDDMLKLRYFSMQWLDASDAQIGANIDENTFSPNTSNAWTAFELFTNPIQAPAGAAKLVVNFRAYNGVGYTAGSTTLWVDDLTVTEQIFIDPDRTAGDVTQTSDLVGGSLNFVFDAGTYVCDITQPIGENVPWVVANATYAPYSGNWIGVAIDFPAGFTGASDIVALNIDGVAQTGPFLSAEETAAGELWYYFEMDGASDVTHTLVVNWDGLNQYETEIFVINAIDLALQENPAIQQGIDNTDLTLTPATQTIMTTDNAVVNMTLDMPLYDADFPADMYGDVLFTFSNALPAGANILITQDATTVADYTATGGETSLWFFEDMSATLDRIPMTDFDDNTYNFVITFSNMSVQTTYNMTVSLIGDLMTGFTNPADWYVFASDNAEIIVSDVPLFTIPLYEGFESGFTYFGNQTGNQVNFTEVTSFVFAGTKAVQNAYGVSNNNKLVMLGPVNLSSVTNPILKFAQIAETEANYDHCYVEISLDGGTTWTILPASAYQGSGTYSVPTQNIPEGPCFTETAYSVWNSSDVVSNTWWRTEKFSLSAYIGQSSVMIRFRLKSDIYVQKTGWFLDAIQIYDELCSEPTAFATTNLWSDGATFAWTSTASLWNIEVGASGFVPGTGVAVATFTGVTTNPFQVSGLSPATTYQAYIQANCGGANGVSLWTGPVTFTTLPACPAPTNVTVTNITISGAQVNWTQPGLPNTWDLIYGLTGFNPGIEGTLINNSTTNPTTISGLSAQTNYQVYVRADCGGTTSAWVGPISFSTPCTAVSTFPFTESFNGTTFAPMCWTNVKVSGTGTPGIWDRQTAGTSPTCTPHSGAGMARYNSYNLSSGTNGILATPALEFPSDNYQVVFWMYRDNGYATYSNEKVNVYYNTQNSLTGATQLGSISRYYGFAPAVATANAWYEYTFFLPAGVSGTGYIIFQAVSQLGNNMFIDDITVMEKPPCPVPASPASSNVLGNQATLSWTGGASATSYEIIYGPQGFNPSTSGTLITGIAGSPYTLTGLTSATAYSFYVRTNCGGTLTDWSTVSNFTTSCDVIDDFTWTEEFTTWSNITTCWNLTGGSQTPLHYNSTALHANYWSWYSGTTAYAASPIFDISALTNPAIEFFWSHQYSSSYPTDRLVLQVSDDGGATWDDLWDKSGANFNSNDGAGNTTPGSYKTTGYIDISAYTGNIKFRFYFYSGYGPDVFIDKVSILDLPSCMFPSALTASNLTNTTADLAWVESFGATVWDVIYGAPGFDPETEGTLMADLTTNPYTLGSLDDGTTYEAYVRSNCGGGDVSTWVGPVSFTTVPYCLSPVSLAAGSITLEGASITWTDTGTATAYDLIYGANGFDPLTEGTLVEDVTSPYVISGLNPATVYDVYVRSDCSGDNSPWSTVLNFNTLLCSTGDQCVFDFDLLDSWGDGWNGNSIDIYQAGIFVQNLTLASGSSASVNVNLCPGLESYIVYHTGSYISEVSFTITAPWGDVIYTGSGFTDASNNQTIFTWYSDCVPPTCPIPSAFAIGDEGIDNVSLSWTEEGTATMWDVIYGVPGFDNETEGTIVQDVADNDPYTLSGLSPETTYEVYVRSDCGAGDESYWVGPLSFTTLPSCPDPWDFAVTNVTYNAGEFNWTDYGVATQWDIIYGDPGFDPETEGTLEAAITMAPHVITGFTPETQYEAYLRADCGAGDYSNWVGPISFTTTPTCPTPSDISASNITANSAEINWAENGDATLWDIVYGLPGFNPLTEGTLVSDLTTTAYLIDGVLNASTTYQVYVRANCGGGDYSDWVGPYDFSTACDVITSLPWTENFDLMPSIGTSIVPTCWVATSGSGTPWASANAASNTYNDPFSAPNYITVNWSPTATDKYLVTPGFALTAGQSYDFSFKYVGDGYTGWTADVRYNTAQSGTGSTMLGTAFQASGTAAATSYSNIMRTFVAPTTGIYYFMVHVNNNITPYYLGFDNFRLELSPTCLPVSSVTASQVTNHVATVSWVANGAATTWNLVYGPNGFNPLTEGTLVEGITTTSYQITGLSPTTQYQVYVQGDCGAGDLSIWSDPVSFTTLVACPAIVSTSLTDATYESLTIEIDAAGTETEWNVVYGLHGFVVGEGTTIVVTENPFTVTGLIPETEYDFYIQANCGADGNSTFSSVISYSTTELCPDVWAVTVTNITTEGAQVAWSHSSAQDTWNIEVGLPGFIPGTGAAVLTFTGVTENPYIITTGLTPETNYTAYVMADCGANGSSGWIGSATFTTLPTCLVPVSVTMSAVTSGSATVSWTEAGTATTWNVLYGPFGFNPLTEGTLVEGISSTSYIIEGLDDATQYSVYVQADCGGGDLSNWTTVTSFYTQCGIIDEFTWLEEFTVWSDITQCWDLTGGTRTVAQYGGTAVRANYWSWSSGNTAYLKTPLIDKSSLTNPKLEFYWSHLYSSSYPNDKLTVQVSDDNGATWTDVWMLTGAIFNSADGATNTTPGTYISSGVIDLSSFGNNIYVRFYFLSGWGPDVFINNVSIYNLVCDAPADLAVASVDNNSAIVSWTDVSGEGEADIIYGAVGFDPLTEGTVVDNVSNPYTLTNLNPETAYDVYVRSVCELAGESIWTGPLSFTTLADCPQPTNLNAVAGSPTTAVVSWSDNSGEGTADVLYGAQGFNPATQGTLVSNATNPYTITGLSPETTYDVYVHSVCALTGESLWTGPFTFTTPAVLNDEADILSYTFGAGVDYSPATIDNVAKTVHLYVAEGTSLNNLIATFTLSTGASATVAAVPQVSGTTANNFATGPLTYVVTAEDGTTTNNWIVTVEVWVGIGQANQFAMQVLPNPNNGRFTLYINHTSDKCRYELTDVTGRILVSKQLEGKGQISENFDLNLAPGSYYLRVISGNKVKTQKLIIE